MLSLVRSVLVASLLLGGVLLVNACKQGSGERCQIDDDCEEGLICTNQGFCGTDNPTPTFDAAIGDARADASGAEADAGEADASEADAGEADAAPDAMPDAS
jgi:hypothetical protein